MIMKNFYWCFLLMISLSSGIAQTPEAVIESERAASEEAIADEIMQQEMIRREELLLKSSKILDEADSLAFQGKIVESKAKVEEVLKSIPAAGAGVPVHDRARKLLSAINAKEASDLLNKSDYFGARTKAIEALKRDPNNPAAAEVLARCDEFLQIAPGTDTPSNPAITAKHVEKLTEVRNLMASSKQHIDTGQFEEAEKMLQSILEIDPYNRAAAERLLDLYKERRRIAKIRLKTENQKRTTDVRGGWSTFLSVEDDVEQAGGGEDDAISGPPTFPIHEKLKNIPLPEVNFDKASIRDAAEFLTIKSRELDKEGAGVSFVIKNERVLDQAKPFSLRLKNVPLGEALRYITTLAGVNFKVEEFAVFIVPLDDVDQVLVTREFPAPPSFINEAPAATSDTSRRRRRSAVTVVGNTTGKSQVQRVLESKGITFPKGASAIYNISTGILRMTNTQEQVDYLEALLGDGSEQLLVKIQTRFVEINQTDLESLAPNFSLEGGNTFLGQVAGFSGSNFAWGNVAAGTNLLGANGIQTVDGINRIINLTPPLSASSPQSTVATANRVGVAGVVEGNGFTALVDLLSQASSTNLMTAPAIVVNDGEKGVITVAREFFFPVEFDQPQVSPPVTATTATAGGGAGGGVLLSSATVIPAWPTEYEKRDVGVSVTVVPKVTVDRQRVFLNIQPTVTEFDGFINYGSSIASTIGFTGTIAGNPVYGSVSTPILLNNNVINQPVFTTRTVENAKVEIQDGYTMVLAGLIREDISTVEDKVPVLGDLPFVGRAFRSKAEQSIKKNLLIFVNVRILRPDGQPYNSVVTSVTE